MSGPHLSMAEIEAQRRAELERKRKERLLKIRAAMDALYLECERIRAASKDMLSECEGLETATSDQMTIDKIRSIQNKCCPIMESLISNLSVPTEPSDIDALREQLHEKRAICYEEFQKMIETPRQVVLKLKSFDAHQPSGFNEDDIHDYTGTLSYEFAAIEKTLTNLVDDHELQRRIRQTLIEIERLYNYEANDQSTKNSLMSMVEELQAADGNRQRLMRCLEHCDIKLGRVISCQKEFEELYKKYEEEAKLYQSILASGKRKKIYKQKTRSEFSSIEKLFDELKIVRTLVQREDEIQFIRRQLDEVMKEEGYDVSEEIVLNEYGTDFLCAVDKDYAIHVAMADEGAFMITMEVSKIRSISGHNKGSAEGCRFQADEKLSEQEVELLIQARLNFCKTHPRLKEKLSKRGVILKEEDEAPKADDRRCCRVIEKYESSEQRKNRFRESEEDENENRAGSHAVRYAEG